MKRIWVIEAPGKRAAFRKALDDAGFVGEQILATYGRLFDLPAESLGFDEKLISHPEKHTEIIWEPKRTDQVKKLIGLISPADEVVIATDSDLEGELIASQVEGICRIASSKTGLDPTIVRVHIRSLTGSSIRKAYEAKTCINENKVRAGKSRRILDRLLGYRLHGQDDPWRLSVGRVVTPLVNSLFREPAESVVIRKKLDEGWSAVIRLNTVEAIHTNTITDIVQSLPQPDLSVAKKEELSFEHKPLTGPEALKLCVRSLSASPSDIREAIQRNYEKARLSYPRSDSRTLDEVGIKWISRMAANEAIGFYEDLVDARQGELLERSYDAHNAVLPIVEDIPDSSVPLDYLSVDEAVLRIIADHSMRIGDEPEVFTRETGVLNQDHSGSQRWRQSLSRWNDCLTFIRDRDQNDLVYDPLRHELTRKADLSSLSVSRWHHPVTQIVIERLMEIGLGRPSTLLMLAEKAYSSYLDSNGRVNGRGRLMLEKMMQRLPELLSTEAARELEHVVSDTQHDASIGDRLSKAWEVLKKNPILLGSSDSHAPVMSRHPQVDATHQEETAPDDGIHASEPR